MLTYPDKIYYHQVSAGGAAFSAELTVNALLGYGNLLFQFFNLFNYDLRKDLQKYY